MRWDVVGFNTCPGVQGLPPPADGGLDQYLRRNLSNLVTANLLRNRPIFAQAFMHIIASVMCAG
jgi:hypothetical protein